MSRCDYLQWQGMKQYRNTAGVVHLNDAPLTGSEGSREPTAGKVYQDSLPEQASGFTSAFKWVQSTQKEK